MCSQWLNSLTGYLEGSNKFLPRHQAWALMNEAKVSWLVCLDRLVSRINNTSRCWYSLLGFTLANIRDLWTHVSWCLRATCPLAPPFLLNYITQLPWWPHKLLLPNCSPCLGPCKWQPPQSPFASALVTDSYQYSGCRATHVRGVTL